MDAKLTKAVIRQLGGRDSLQDIANHGIDGGFCGFVYYTETVKFFKSHRQLIVDLVREEAQEFGQDPIAFVAGFGCLEDDLETREEIARALYGRMGKDDYLVANALSWFAAEEVARFETDK